MTHPLSQPPVSGPHATGVAGRGALLWSSLVASLIACGVPLLLGLAQQWSLAKVGVYAGLATLFVGLSQLPRLCSALAVWLLGRTWRYLVVMSIIALALQTISGDPFLQPIAFEVPFIYAALSYRSARTIVAALSLLSLMLLGLWLSGERAPAAFLFPLTGYSSLMVLIYAFARLFAEQIAARRAADLLAADLARQRDHLARLVQATAVLARDLDLGAVVEQIACAGRSLMQVDWVRVWLADGEQLQLSASAPHDCPTVAAPIGPTMPLIWNERTIGILEFGLAGAAVDLTLVQPFANAAAAAVENARLYEQARHSATLAERNRLARELHDTIAQGLTAVTMQLEAAQRSFDRDAARTRARLTRAHELARQALDDVRRSVWTLAEPLIDGSQLSAALADLAWHFTSHTGVAVEYQHFGPPAPIDSAAATQIVRIVREALQNVDKHAQATHVALTSRVTADALQIEVRDDGVGFDHTELMEKNVGNGFGLLSLRERARLAGGLLSVSSAPGAGTSLQVQVAIEQPDQQ